ncbi:L,D-transpeptidase family protein [Sphingomonas bacterium]|uniref:L,D-transpeptidase family protein n=1 Tax=Sphingomonas bacterium TaxID=1895847 RepID=UPI001576502D|nr:L,D-transpeptidase family protein [Sphingomonas bacterium]
MAAWTSRTPARWIALGILGATLTATALRIAAPAIAAPVAAPVRLAIAAKPHKAAAIVRPTKVAVAAPVPAPSPTALVIRRVLDTRGPIRYGSFFWDEAGVPAGPLTITVDLKASVLSVFRGGYEIGTTAVIYGADDRETPLGVFPILQKDRHHVSNLYHAPMPYMLRLTGDGVSIHASEIAANYATHGCIGVPAGFARKLFEAASLGDRVIVTRQGMRSDIGTARPIVS